MKPLDTFCMGVLVGYLIAMILLGAYSIDSRALQAEHSIWTHKSASSY